MKSVNRVTLMGAVGKDPEIRHSQQGLCIASFSLATSKKQKDKDPVTQWHNIVAFGKTGELVESYVTKGSKLYIEGELQYQEYEKDGEKRYATKIVINDMSFLGDNSNQGATQGKQKASGSGKKASQPPLQEFEDDSIPF
jgi:single-strand DNA-binding protein